MSLILTFFFYIILLDPTGFLRLKFPILILLIIHFLIVTKEKKIRIELILITLGLIIFSIFFIFKQEVFFEFNEPSRVVAQTIFLFGLLLFISAHSTYIECLYQAMRLFLITNLVLLTIGVFFQEVAIDLNLVLKKTEMVSLEMREHYVSPYSFYHNSIYAAIVYFPKICYDLTRQKLFTLESFICILCLISLVLSQSRSIYFGILTIIFLHYYRYFFAILPVVFGCLVVSFLNLESLLFDNSTNMKLQYPSVMFDDFVSLKKILFGTGPLLIDFGPNIGNLAIVELTYFELFRYFGLLGSIILLSVIIYLCLRLRSDRKLWLYGSGVVGYLAMCFFNPYVWGLTGLPLLAIPLALSFDRNRNC